MRPNDLEALVPMIITRSTAHMAMMASMVWLGGCGGALPTVDQDRTGLGETRPQGVEEVPRIGLALSGGGYRASLHALGALRALEDSGLLSRVEIVSSVSGGSLTAAYYIYRRASEGDDFQFDDFQADLLTILSSYELPRSVLAAELQEATSGATSGLARCVATRLGKTLILSRLKEGKIWKDLKSLLVRPDPETRSAVGACAEEAMQRVRYPDLAHAIRAYAGGDCDPQDPVGWMDRCLAADNRSIAATLNSALVALVLDTEERGEVQRTFCTLRQQLCQRPALKLLPRSLEKPVPHPMSELLHLSLFQPWAPDQEAVHMADLAGLTRPLLEVTATSTHRGELRSGSPLGAGVRERVSKTRAPTWRPHGDRRGPRLADAVAASACYPLFCRPVPMAGPDGGIEMLTDGGVYDNLGIRSLLQTSEDTGGAVNVLVVAAAHRPYVEEEDASSRSGTVLRLIDMMLEQRSQTTLQAVDKQARDTGACPPLHVSLARTKDTKDLGALPTDLKPIKGDIQALLNESVTSIKDAFAAHPCLGSP